MLTCERAHPLVLLDRAVCMICAKSFIFEVQAFLPPSEPPSEMTRTATAAAMRAGSMMHAPTTPATSQRKHAHSRI